jgi:hypothetical protein
VRKEVDDAVDLVPAATSGNRCRTEAEEAEDTIDIDEEQRFVGHFQEFSNPSTYWHSL